MQPRRPVQRLAGAVAVSSITAAAVAGVPTAGAPAATIPAAGVAPCVAWTGGEQPPDPGGSVNNNSLWGVAVLSPCNAWAVGDYDPGQTLIAHWDGASWTQVPSPNPAIPSRLFGVHALSASNVWAVGEYFDGSIVQDPDRALGRLGLDPGAKPERERCHPERSQGCARQLGHERLGGGLLRQQQQRGPDADPALERDVLEAGAEPGPERPGPGPGAHQRGQQLRPGRVGGRFLLHRLGQVHDPALERVFLEAGAEPEPRLAGHFPVRRALHLGQQRVGGGLGLQRHARTRP